MIVRTMDEVQGSERDVYWGNGQSRRFLLERDGMGFTFTNTVVKAGTESLIEYKNHVEACYCFQGDGEIELMNGEVYSIKVGTMYAANAHDMHYLRGGKSDMHLICIFVPALEGQEVHNFEQDGASSY